MRKQVSCSQLLKNGKDFLEMKFILSVWYGYTNTEGVQFSDVSTLCCDVNLWSGC